MQMRDRVMENPWALGAFGGLVGIIAGKLIGNRARSRYERIQVPQRRMRSYEFGEPYPRPQATEGGVIITEDEMYGFEAMPDSRSHTNYDVEKESVGYRPGEEQGHGEAIKQKASETIQNVKEKAGEFRHRASDRYGDLRHRASDRYGDLRHRASDRYGDLRHRAAERYEHVAEQGDESMQHFRERSHELRGRASEMVRESKEHSAVLGVGAMAAGILFGLMMPVTERERRTIGPAKQKAMHRAEEEFRNVREQAVERVSDIEHKVADVVKSEIAGGLKGKQGEQQGGTTESRGTYTASEEGSEFTPVPDPDITRH